MLSKKIHLVLLLLIAGMFSACSKPGPDKSVTPSLTFTATVLPSATPSSVLSSPSPSTTPTHTPTRYQTPRVSLPAPAGYTGSLPPGLIGRLGMGSLYQVTSSPGGKHLAIASGVGVYIYSSASFDQEQFILADDIVRSVAWSPDGLYIAGGVGENVIIWNVKTTSVVHILETGFASRIKWSPGSDGLAVVFKYSDWTEGLSVWNIYDDVPRFILKGNQVSNHESFRLEIDWSSTNKLALTESGGQVRVLNGETGDLLYQFMGSQIRNPVAWSHDGSTLVVINHNSLIQFLNGQNGDEMQAIEIGENAYISELIWSEDGQYLALSNIYPLTIGVLDVRTSKLEVIPGQTANTDSLAWFEGNKMLVSLDGRSFIAWDRETRLPKHVLRSSNIFEDVVWSQDGKFISAIDRANIISWNVASGQAELVSYIASDYSWVIDMALSPDGKWYAAVYGGDGRYLDIWDARTGEVKNLNIGAEPGLDWSPNGDYIVARNRHLQPTIWESRTGKILKEFTFQAGDFYPWGIDWSPDGSMIAGANGEVFLLKFPSGTQWYLLKNCGAGIVNLIWSPDSTILAALSTDGNIYICDPKADTLLQQLQNLPEEAYSSMTWSPDGHLLAVTSYRYRYIASRLKTVENTVIVWDTKNWQRIRTIQKPVPFSSVAFSPDSKTLAISCWDGTIWLIEP